MLPRTQGLIHSEFPLAFGCKGAMWATFLKLGSAARLVSNSQQPKFGGQLTEQPDRTQRMSLSPKGGAAIGRRSLGRTKEAWGPHPTIGGHP